MQSQPESKSSLLQKVRSELGFKFSWRAVQDYAFILLGSLVQAISMRLFLIPAQLVSGGISGAAQIINFYTHWPIGLMVFMVLWGRILVWLGILTREEAKGYPYSNPWEKLIRKAG